MMTGGVEGRHAYIAISVYGPDERELEVQFVLDTGFTAEITLPLDLCESLGLMYLRTQPADLANGTMVMFEVYEAALLWDDIERTVEVLAMEGVPLVGMTLLDGFEVCLRVKGGGTVTIEAL